MLLIRRNMERHASDKGNTAKDTDPRPEDGGQVAHDDGRIVRLPMA